MKLTTSQRDPYQSPDYYVDNALLAVDLGDAEEEACRDVDGIADWLGGVTLGAPVPPVLHRRCPVMFDPTAVATPTLLALAFDAGQPSIVRVRSVDELRTRYLSDAATQRGIDRRLGVAA